MLLLLGYYMDMQCDISIMLPLCLTLYIGSRGWPFDIQRRGERIVCELTCHFSSAGTHSTIFSMASHRVILFSLLTVYTAVSCILLWMVQMQWGVLGRQYIHFHLLLSQLFDFVFLFLGRIFSVVKMPGYHFRPSLKIRWLSFRYNHRSTQTLMDKHCKFSCRMKAALSGSLRQY